MKHRAEDKPHWVRDEQMPTLEEIAWLTGPEGRAVCLEMAGGEPADTPAAIERWRARCAPPHVAAAWRQVLLRAAARAKFARADAMLFDRVGLEQSTNEAVATYKSRRFAGLNQVVDLCCGIGGDALALAVASKVTAIDWSDVRAAMVRHNASVYGRRIETRTGDVAFDSPEADAAHIDPDRRATGRRRHDADGGSPSLAALERIVARYRRVAIKLSPGADFEALPFDAEIELISHHGECKQAVAWTGGFRQAHRRATVLTRRGDENAGRRANPGHDLSHELHPSRDREGAESRQNLSSSTSEQHSKDGPHFAYEAHTLAAQSGESLGWPAAHQPEPGDFLFEPDPAVIRADLVGVLARYLRLAPVDPRIAWLVGTTELDHAMLRTFRVMDLLPWSARPARAWLARHHIGPLEIKTRGFAARPEDILKQLRPCGRRPGVLFLTRLADRPTAILAERIGRW